MDYDRPIFHRISTTAAAADHDVVDMVSGSPDWGPPPALREGLREYADLGPGAYGYAPSAGIVELREEIATRRGVDVEQVVVTNGCAEANYLAMARALERGRGDEILTTDPAYPYYPAKTTLLGGTQRFVPVDADGQLDPDDLNSAASEDTACIVVSTPNNPTGAVYPRRVMSELVAIAEEHDALLVSDEVYDHFDLTGHFASALEIDSSHRIVTNAFSKSLGVTGFRVGYVVVPHEHLDAVAKRHMLVNVSASRPAQYAVARALAETDPEYYERNRAVLGERVEAFTDALERIGAAYTTPEGGFYVLARFDDVPGTLAGVERLIDEAGVAGMPGAAFGRAREDWIRFALVTDRVEVAARRLTEHLG